MLTVLQKIQPPGRMLCSRRRMPRSPRNRRTEQLDFFTDHAGIKFSWTHHQTTASKQTNTPNIVCQ